MKSLIFLDTPELPTKEGVGVKVGVGVNVGEGVDVKAKVGVGVRSTTSSFTASPVPP